MGKAGEEGKAGEKGKAEGTTGGEGGWGISRCQVQGLPVQGTAYLGDEAELIGHDVVVGTDHSTCGLVGPQYYL